METNKEYLKKNKGKDFAEFPVYRQARHKVGNKTAVGPHNRACIITRVESFEVYVKLLTDDSNDTWDQPGEWMNGDFAVPMLSGNTLNLNDI